MKLTEILKILISHILKEYIPEDKEIYMTKSRKVNKQERIGIVKYCMDNDLNYTKAAEAYETTYTNIFSWLRSIVKKVQRVQEKNLNKELKMTQYEVKL